MFYFLSFRDVQNRAKRPRPTSTNGTSNVMAMESSGNRASISDAPIRKKININMAESYAEEDPGAGAEVHVFKPGQNLRFTGSRISS